MNELKLAFVGYGKHARANLYPSLRLLGEKIAAVCTTRAESAELAGSEYGIPGRYTDVEKMLSAEKPDAVFVCTQPSEMLPIVSQALEAGCHVFAEKPLGMNVTEAQAIADLAEKQNKQVMVGFMKRFAPAYVKIKEVLDSREIGAVQGITQLFTSRNFAKTPTEYLLFAAIHYIDLMSWYIGSAEQITGFTSVTPEVSVQSYALKFSNNALGSVQYMGSPAWERAAHEMTITGEKGYVRVQGIDKVIVYKKNSTISIPRWQVLEENEQTFGTMLTTGIGGVQPLYLNGFVGELKHFIESIENGTPPLTSAVENLRTMKTVDQMLNTVKL
jgi:predicted dehydrogenase